MIERRRHYRFLVSGTAVLRLKPSKDEVDGTMRDLSMGGVAVYAYEKIAVGQPVTAEIKLVDSEGSEIIDTLSGKVVWAQPWGGLHVYGIAFDEMITRETNTPLFVFMENLKKTTDLSP